MALSSMMPNLSSSWGLDPRELALSWRRWSQPFLRAFTFWCLAYIHSSCLYVSRMKSALSSSNEWLGFTQAFLHVDDLNVISMNMTLGWRRNWGEWVRRSHFVFVTGRELRLTLFFLSLWPIAWNAFCDVGNVRQSRRFLISLLREVGFHHLNFFLQGDRSQDLWIFIWLKLEGTVLSELGKSKSSTHFGLIVRHWSSVHNKRVCFVFCSVVFHHGPGFPVSWSATGRSLFRINPLSSQGSARLLSWNDFIETSLLLHSFRPLALAANSHIASAVLALTQISRTGLSSLDLLCYPRFQFHRALTVGMNKLLASRSNYFVVAFFHLRARGLVGSIVHPSRLSRDVTDPDVGSS